MVEIDIYVGAIITDAAGNRWKVVDAGKQSFTVRRYGVRFLPKLPQFRRILYRGQEYWFTSSYMGEHELVCYASPT